MDVLEAQDLAQPTKSSIAALTLSAMPTAAAAASTVSPWTSSGVAILCGTGKTPNHLQVLPSHCLETKVKGPHPYTTYGSFQAKGLKAEF